MANEVPVFIQGMHFPSITAAARHFGISPQTVFRAIETGRTDSVGTGSLFPAKPVEIRGVKYPSRYRAAKTLGIDPAFLSRLIKHGLLEAWLEWRDSKPYREMVSRATLEP